MPLIRIGLNSFIMKWIIGHTLVILPTKNENVFLLKAIILKVYGGRDYLELQMLIQNNNSMMKKSLLRNLFEQHHNFT